MTGEMVTDGSYVPTAHRVPQNDGNELAREIRARRGHGITHIGYGVMQFAFTVNYCESAKTR